MNEIMKFINLQEYLMLMTKNFLIFLMGVPLMFKIFVRCDGDLGNVSIF